MSKKVPQSADAQLELFGADTGSADPLEDVPAPDAQSVSSESEEFSLSPVEESRAAVRSTYSQEVRAQAVRFFAAGEGYRAVSRMLSLPVYTVREWELRYKSGSDDRVLADEDRRVEAYSDAVRERVLRLRFADGMSYNKIALMTGVNRCTVRYWINSAEQAKIEKDAKAEGKAS